MNNKTLGAISVLAAAAVAVIAWRAHAEVVRLDQSLGEAHQQIEQLNRSLAKAREALNATRAELDRSLDDADQTRQTKAQASASPPVYQPPLEMAQLQTGQSADLQNGPVDAMLELKGRH